MQIWGFAPASALTTDDAMPNSMRGIAGESVRTQTMFFEKHRQKGGLRPTARQRAGFKGDTTQ